MKTPFLLLSALALPAYSAFPTSVNDQITDSVTQTPPVKSTNKNNTTDNKQLDTVKVTADFRQMDVQQIPSAITVVNDEAIDNRSADHLESILSLAPNVNFASGSSRGRYFQIRGIGERSQFIDPVNPSVGLYIDGIDMTGLGGAATLFDIEQVEILRGPQGTAFGANALAGAINIKSKQPTEEFEGYIQGKVGNYNTQSLGGAVSGSLSDKLQARFSFNQFLSDGYIENTHLDREDTNDFDELVSRLLLRYQANSKNQIGLSFLNVDIDNGYDAFSLYNTNETLSDEPGRDKQNTLATSIKWNNSSLTFANIDTSYSYSDSRIDYGFDEDWTFTGFHPDGYTSTDRYIRTYERQSIDLRATSNINSKLLGNTTDWTLGLYSQIKEEDMSRFYTWNSGTYTSLLEDTSTSIYSELTSTLSPTITLTYGFRVENSDITYQNSSNIQDNVKETLIGGKATIDLMLTPEHLGYTSIARGYKAGGVNSDPDISDSNRVFDSEKNNSFEIGLKSSLLNDTLSTRIAAFYIQRLDQQVKSSYAIQNPDSSFSFQDYLANAAEGRNIGLELESKLIINQNFIWNTSLGYLNTEFSDYTFTTSGGTQSKNGREQAHAPKWSFASNIELGLTRNIKALVEIEGKEEFYFSDSHDEKSKAYILAHAKLTYTKDSLEVSLNGHNLTDKDYSTKGFGFGNNPENGYTDTQHIQLGAPRLISLSAKYNF